MSHDVDTNSLHKSLTAIGLSEDESSFYLELFRNGPISPAHASKALGIPRTTVYRIGESLLKKGLIQQQLHGRGMRFEAQAPKAFESMIRVRQEAIDKQRETLPSLLGALTNLVGQSSLGSHVIYYEGIEGLKQVTLNSLEAQTELCIYEIDMMSGFLDEETSEEIRTEMAKKNIQVRQLTNSKRISAWTQTDLVKTWECRYVDPKQLRMQFEMLIYDDVFVTYTYSNREVFCVEIRSSGLAAMQRQLFDYIWGSAKRMRRTGAGGAVRVVA